MGNVVQRLTHRGGEFRLTQSNEGSSKTPKITVSSEDSSNNQDEDLEPNGGEDGLTYNSNFTSQSRRIFFFTIHIITHLIVSSYKRQLTTFCGMS